MNGVIINDEHIHELAFKETVKPFNILLDHAGYLECCAGKTDKAGYESIAGKFATNLPITQLLIEKGDQYLRLFPQHKQSYPFVLELIRSLFSSFKLAVTSSSSRREVDLILKEFGVYELFAITISGEDVTNGKPDPEPYVKTAKLLGVTPSECVVIEDSKSGVISAKAAGIRRIMKIK